MPDLWFHFLVTMMESMFSPRVISSLGGHWKLCLILLNCIHQCPPFGGGICAKRWAMDYFSSLRKFSRWHSPSRKFKVGNIVMLHEETFVPTKWPLAKVIDLHPGNDSIVRVVTLLNCIWQHLQKTNHQGGSDYSL